MVATKLRLSDAKVWIDYELGGYAKDAAPKYRELNCELVAYTSRGYIPVVFQDPQMAADLKKVILCDPVAHLEELANSSGGTVYIPFHEALEKELMEYFDEQLRPLRKVGPQQLKSVLQAIRDGVLRWSLQLEQDGILGDGLMFTEDERERAATQRIHIGTFNGVLGDVSESVVQVGDYASIHEDLKKAGISQEERNELENILDEMKRTDGEEKKSLASRGLAWTMKHAAALGSLVETIKPWLGIEGPE